MRWLLTLLRSLFGARRDNGRHQLMGMYLDESNNLRKRKTNRDRA